MKMTRRNVLLALIPASLLLFPVIGCGGGGGSSPNPSPSASPVATFPLVSRLRTIQGGDTANYSGTGTYTEVGKAPVTVTANIRHSITSLSYKGDPALQSTQSITLNVSGTDIVENVSEIQRQNGTTGDLFSIASREDTDIDLLTPAIALPGTFSHGYNYNNDLTYEDSTTSRETFVIVGTETVATPIGKFETWKATSTITDSESSTQHTRWYAPQLGTFVKAEAIQTITGVATVRFTVTLDSVSFTF